jgi:(2Fe-2S) ferredoxin
MPPPYRRHVFVCENDRPPGDPRGCCLARGGAEVREALRRELKARDLSRVVRANKAGCLDACEHGVTVVVYPEGVWYGGVTPADVPEIVESHLVGGRPVERLVFAKAPPPP